MTADPYQEISDQNGEQYRRGRVRVKSTPGYEIDCHPDDRNHSERALRF